MRKSILVFITLFLLFQNASIAQTFDLELKKEVNYNLPGLNGTDIPFDITIYNHGDDVSNIVITDSIPTGFTFNPILNPGWSTSAPVVAFNVPSDLLAGDSTTITIQLTLDSIAMPSTVRNKAVISSFTDTNGNLVIDDNLNNNIDEDEAPIFDLALRKTILNSMYNYGGVLNFKITVFNQGNIPATDVEIKEFIAPGYFYLQAVNAGWTNEAQPRYTFPNTLLPGDSMSVIISLYQLNGVGGIGYWANRAAIWNASDDLGVNRNLWDFDSEAQTNDVHERAVLAGSDFDNEINGRFKLNDPITGSKVPNLDEDEDDHDVASPEIFDLALTLKQQTALLSFSYGQFVNMDVDIYNQGNIPAMNILVTDSIPCGLEFNQAMNPLWSYNAGTRKASILISDTIPAGDMITIPINLQVMTCFIDQVDAWTTYAEITSVTDTLNNLLEDIDSTPDDNFGNDQNVLNDEINQDGKNTNGDEDDMDYHRIEVVDLALKKIIVNDIDYEFGDTIDFTISVYNQGNMVLQDIHILEHITDDYIFSEAINPGWDPAVGSGNNRSFTIPTQLIPEDSVEVMISLILNGFDDIENYAEVESVRDANFVGRDDDADSQVNSDTPVERSVHQGDLDDNNIYSFGENNINGVFDQDDHDPARPKVNRIFDLSLNKVHQPLPFDMAYGDIVGYDITINNEGDVKATNIEIKDHIPCGFDFDELLNPTWNYDANNNWATKTITDTLLRDSSLTAIIYLTLKECVENDADSWTNIAEISGAEDTDGNSGDDIDSTPDNNDPLEDDQDDDVLPVFDLSLIKTHDYPDSIFNNGDIVTYNISISNDGNVDANNIEITDLLPCGLEFNAGMNPTWNYNIATSEITKIITTELEPGNAVTETLYLIVEPCNTGSPTAWENKAEITANEDGDENPADDIDSTPDNDVPSEDDQDTDELLVNQEFDLSLEKTHTSLPLDMSYGDIINYEIVVTNEGDIDATNVEITDYIPCGLSFSTGLNPTWSYDMVSSTASKTIAGTIAAGTSITEVLQLELIACDSNTSDAWTNIAEISSGDDPNGDPIDDIDSTPDNNDPTEDDQDDDILPVFDLSLTKNHDYPDSTFNNGDIVTYNIQITNEGNVNANNIEITDYLPCGLQFNAGMNPTWSYNMATSEITKVITTELQSGNAVAETLYLIVEPCNSGSPTAWENKAEITANEDGDENPADDIDSTPDNDVPSEDDQDTDDLLVNQEFDLSLEKTHTNLPTDMSYGDIINYEIVITNEGDIDATNVEITDYIPCGLSFSAGLNPTWSYDIVSSTASKTIAGTIAAGTSITEVLQLELIACNSNTSDAWTNIAEISSGDDPNGDPIDDIDSTPDNNDPSEDDQDEDILPVFDLSLTKNHDYPDSTFNNGDIVTYNIQITNEGNVNANNIEITDYLPCGLQFNAGMNPTWSYNMATSEITKVITTELQSGNAVTETLYLIVESCNSGSPIAWENKAEITANEDDDENPADDIDSTPDNDVPSEDDQDTDDLLVNQVFDLSLEKNHNNLPSDMSYGDIVTFNFKVTNEGDIDAANVEISDYVPCGFLFVGNLNPTWNFNPITSIASKTIAGSIDHGTNVTTTIQLVLVSCQANGVDSWKNTTEISFATDLNDEPIDDIDSTPNNGDPEEDDFDEDNINVFDLSLEKGKEGALASFSYGQQTVFVITVRNEGNVNAKDVVIKDIIPCGFTFNQALNPTWTYNNINNTATTTIPEVLVGGESIVLIELDVIPCYVDPATAWTNYAEIIDAKDESGNPVDDIDSTPNNGIIEEDDMDYHMIQVFDLAVTNEVVNDITYLIGDDVTFKINIYNQGNVNATEVVISDYLPASYVLGDGNMGWTLNSGVLNYTIPNIGIGSSASVEVVLRIMNGMETEIYAEMYSARDGNGIMRDDDADSQNHSDTPAERSIHKGDPDDNNIFSLGLNWPPGAEDQDDHDPADIDLLLSGSIGDYVWNDLNADGIQEDGEYGVPGMLVELYTCAGSYVRSVYTDNAGAYLFDEVITGSYKVRFDINSISGNAEFSGFHYGSDLGLDSDAGEDGYSDCLFVEAGQDNLTIDAGVIQLGALGNYVWHDENGDGIQQAYEDGISNVSIQLFNQWNALVGTTVTNNNGYYLFDNLVPGNYYLHFDTPEFYNNISNPNEGINQNTDSDIDHSNGINTTTMINISYGETDFSWDAGFYQCVRIGNNVWYDYNENDLFDANENGLNGIRVNLYRKVANDWILWDYQYTGNNPEGESNDGWYEFCSSPGTYYIKVLLPPYGLVPALPNVGNNELIDSDITDYNGNGTTHSFTLGSGQHKLDLGAGYYPMGTVGDKVWFDSDGDGYQDSYEEAAANIEVRIYNSNDVEVYSTVTDAQGNYEIDYLQRGDYYLAFTPPSGYAMTSPNEAPDNFDSDVDHSNGSNTTNFFHIEPGDEIPSIDAGLILGVLPVVWESIEVNNFGLYNTLNWTTASELNNDHFEVEVRHESEKEFHFIANVLAGKNPNAVQTYSVNDFEIDQKGIYYYRVKQVDNDGRINYSDIVSVVIDKDQKLELIIYPNPTVKDIYVSYELEEASELEVVLFDHVGKNIVESLVNEYREAGSYNEKFEFDYLPKGTYILQVNIGGEQINQPIIILRK